SRERSRRFAVAKAYGRKTQRSASGRPRSRPHARRRHTEGIRAVPRIGLDRKVFPGALQAALELGDLVGGDSLVRATEDTQQWDLDLTHDIQRCGSRWFGF